MKNLETFSKYVRKLIDDLKSVCANYGLGNDGNEFKIISQVFLYKFLHDKFIAEIKSIDSSLLDKSWEKKLSTYDDDEFEILTMQISENTAILKPDQLISSLFKKQNNNNFANIFDNTLLEISRQNASIFSVITGGGEKIALFDSLSKYVTDNRDDFCRALINKIVGFSFENIFDVGFDFFSMIFEYLIKDYNIDSGGKYAEYFTPHAVAGIMARCLVPDTTKEKISNVKCYDPSAGSGTLLMNLAHQIGEDKCSVYSQDISQKSSNLLRLNLVLNNLVHSINNIVQGNTLTEPAHRKKTDNSLETFDYIVSNPPFKLDFSDFRDDLISKENNNRFFAGIPLVPPKKKEAMEIYLLFLQHVIFCLKPQGKAAIVVPTGFITAQKGIAPKIRKKLIEENMLKGAISMPSNIFAKTGTNVSVIFLDKTNRDDVILLDASNLGVEIKEGKNQRKILRDSEIDLIIKTFISKINIDDFSINVSPEDMRKRNYSFSAGQYFPVSIPEININKNDFERDLKQYKSDIKNLSDHSEKLKEEIFKNIESLKYEN